MEALKEMGLLALILLVVYLLANLIIYIYWKWGLRQYDKASADYQRGVEEHQAKMGKESESDSSSSD